MDTDAHGFFQLLRAIGGWSLEFLWSLEVGALEFFTAHQPTHLKIQPFVLNGFQWAQAALSGSKLGLKWL